MRCYLSSLRMERSKADISFVCNFSYLKVFYFARTQIFSNLVITKEFSMIKKVYFVSLDGSQAEIL
jgi:hypothetical protein